MPKILVMTSAHTYPPARPYRMSGWGWKGKTASGDGSVRAILHLANRLFLLGNHISDEQQDKEQERAQDKRRQFDFISAVHM